MAVRSRFWFWTLILLSAGALSSSPVLAEKPSHAGKNGKGGKGAQQESGITVNINGYFGSREYEIVREYYGESFRSGHCPPGLAKKHNGCMPPGQAKKWKRGYRLPSDVHYYDLPADIVIRLGAPPSGHRYVRVAADILLIAVGTGMVVDAIEDLSSM